MMDLREDDEATQGTRANAIDKRERRVTLRDQRRDRNTEAKNTISGPILALVAAILYQVQLPIKNRRRNQK